MKCRELEALSTAFLCAELGPGVEAQVREHLGACEHCRALVQSEAELAAGLSQLAEVEPPPDLFMHVRARLEHDEREMAGTAQSWFGVFLARGTGLAGAAALGLVLVYAWNMSTESEEQGAPQQASRVLSLENAHLEEAERVSARLDAAEEELRAIVAELSTDWSPERRRRLAEELDRADVATARGRVTAVGGSAIEHLGPATFNGPSRRIEILERYAMGDF